MRKKIAIILAGCGRFDGSEIHESVLTLLSIKQNNADYQCFSLNQDQDHVTNHLTEDHSTVDKRNMLIESARIARGDIKELQELDVTKFDGLIIPGGNGTAYNLFTLAIDGNNYTVNPLVKQKCLDFLIHKKPMGFICIAPVMIPRIFDKHNVELTIGNDKNIINMLEELGASHFECSANEIHTDIKHKIVTTPAYMLAQDILEAYTGINKLVTEVINLA